MKHPENTANPGQFPVFEHEILSVLRYVLRPHLLAASTGTKRRKAGCLTNCLSFIGRSGV